MGANSAALSVANSVAPKAEKTAAPKVCLSVDRTVVKRAVNWVFQLVGHWDIDSVARMDGLLADRMDESSAVSSVVLTDDRLVAWKDY